MEAGPPQTASRGVAGIVVIRGPSLPSTFSTRSISTRSIPHGLRALSLRGQRAANRTTDLDLLTTSSPRREEAKPGHQPSPPGGPLPIAADPTAVPCGRSPSAAQAGADTAVICALVHHSLSLPLCPQFPSRPAGSRAMATERLKASDTHCQAQPWASRAGPWRCITPAHGLDARVVEEGGTPGGPV